MKRKREKEQEAERLLMSIENLSHYFLMCVCADLRHFFGIALEIGPANENILVLHMHRQQYSRLATKVTLRCVSVCLCVFLLKNFATDFN